MTCFRCLQRPTHKPSFAFCTECSEQLHEENERKRVDTIMNARSPELRAQFAGLTREQVIAKLNEPDPEWEI